MYCGINLPPISHYWHWCRSSITYNAKDSYYYSNKYLKKNTFPYRDIINTLNEASKNRQGKVTIANSITKSGVTYSVNKGEAIQDHSERELEVGKILSDKYGFDVNVLPRIVKRQKEKTPDFTLDGEEWELKQITTNIDNRIRHKKEQSINFIFDITKSKYDNEEIIEQIYSIYKSESRQWVKKVIILKGDTILHYFVKQ